MLGRAAGQAAADAAAAGGKCPFGAAVALKQFFPRPAKEDGRAIMKDDTWAAPTLSKPSSCTVDQYEQLARDVKRAVDAGDIDAPALLRLAFHTTTIGSAAFRGAGSSGGWLAYEADRLCPANAGLRGAVEALMEIRNGQYQGITHADLFTFAGSLGAELAGGPPVAWHPGRCDSTGPGPEAPPLSANVPDGMLNAAGVHQHYMRMGLTVREAVVLTGGGHSIGGATVDATGWQGNFTPNGDRWPKPANKYFIDLMQGEWAATIVPESSQPQYVLVDPSAPAGAPAPAPADGTVFRLPADMALREAVTLAKWAAVYAADEAKFTSDFQRAMQRMLQLGAGIAFELDTSYGWRGFDGKFEGFGTAVPPLDDDA